MKNNQPIDNKKSLAITEAATINGVSRQAIYIAIKKRKLKAHKDNSRWEITPEDLETYRQEKYSRSHSLFEGKLLFDKSQGLYSVRDVAKKLNIPVQKVYYSIRAGLMKATQKRSAWVIHEDEIKSYQEKQLNTNYSKSQAV